MSDSPQQLQQKLGSSKAVSGRCLLDFFQIKHADSVLDIGCGKGVQLILYSLRGAKWKAACGIDLDPEVINEARRLAKEFGLEQTTFQVGDAEALPFADCSVDEIIAVDLIQCVPHPRKALEEMARVLKDGGELMISFPSFWHILLTHLSRLKAYILGRQWNRGGSLSVYAYSLSTWLSLIDGLPFQLIRSRASTLFPPLQRYGIPRFWYSNNFIYNLDRRLGSLPGLKRFGQTMMCVYRKTHN